MLNSCYPDDYANEDFAIDRIAKELLTMSLNPIVRTCTYGTSRHGEYAHIFFSLNENV